VSQAQLSDADNNVRASGELIHHCIPFFLVLLYFLFNIRLLTPKSYKETYSKTYASHLECLKDDASDRADEGHVGH
jgi:hypothetical protein